MNNRTRRIAVLESLAAHRQHQAELDDLETIAEAARNKILERLAAYRRGEPIPASPVRHDSPHHEVLRRRLHEMRERLKRYTELRATYGIR